MNLSPLTLKFVSHFGEMGSRWGFNRTVGQIYALLFITKEPLNADYIGEVLGFSRSNVSMGLKELQSWRLVKMSHQAGDRKEYFSTLGDVWDIFKAVAAERHRREVEPTGTILREIMMDREEGNASDQYAHQQIEKMYDLLEMANILFEHLDNLTPERLRSAIGVATAVQKTLAFKDKITFKKNKSKPSNSQATTGEVAFD